MSRIWESAWAVCACCRQSVHIL